MPDPVGCHPTPRRGLNFSEKRNMPPASGFAESNVHAMHVA
jgi:hypothetical protein